MDITLKKRGHVWAFTVYMPDGTPKGKRTRLSTNLDSRTTPESEALEEAKRIVRSQLGGTVVATDKGVVQTLAAALQAHWDNTWSKSKSACTLQYVIPALQKENISYLPITEVSTKKLREQVRKWQADELAPATINRKLTAISTVLKLAEEDEDLARCPTIPYLDEDNVRERYVTLEEERAALEYIARKRVDEAVGERPKWDLMECGYIVLVDTGMRLSELMGVTEFNLRRLPSGELFGVWLKHGSTKNGNGRVIPLTPRAAIGLERWLLLRNELTDNIKLSGNWLIRRWQTVRKAIPSLADVNLHRLRHTCASRLVSGDGKIGLGIYEVMLWLGHRDIKSTLRYAHLAPGRLSQGVHVLTAVLAPAPVASAIGVHA